MRDRTVTTSPLAAPRGTRPRNRRDLLLSTAATLFYERGYGNVAMKDIAVASNIVPSSLYAHFSSKPELLSNAVAAQMDNSFARLATAPTSDLEELSQRVARGVLENRELGVLWQRDTRNLDASVRDSLRQKMSKFSAVIADAVLVQRSDLSMGQAELLTQCALGAATSISFHGQSLEPVQFEQLLTELCLRMLWLEPAGVTDDRPHVLPDTAHQTRKDELAAAAISLFAQRGFSAVSVDDIGAAVGIAGPSVYKHVRSKLDLLQTAFDRGVEVLQEQLDLALQSRNVPVVALRHVNDSYVELALDQADLITVLIADANHLDVEQYERARHSQRVYITGWVDLLRKVREEDRTVARIKVQAAQMVANDIGRTPRLREVPGWRATIHKACWTLQQ